MTCLLIHNNKLDILCIHLNVNQLMRWDGIMIKTVSVADPSGEVGG